MLGLASTPSISLRQRGFARCVSIEWCSRPQAWMRQLCKSLVDMEKENTLDLGDWPQMRCF